MSDPQELLDDNAPEQPVKQESLLHSMLRSAWGLSLFAIITAGFIALTQVITKDRIVEQIAQARTKALLEIVPAGEFDNNLLDNVFWIEAEAELGLKEAGEVFVALQQGQPRYFILPLIAPDGYTAPIRLIMSVDLSGTVIGLRVIEHKETPGLGDKIDIKKSDWVRLFEGRSLANTAESGWAVKKDGGEFDQLTGATITPRAIVKAVYKGLQYFKTHQAELLSAAGFSESAQPQAIREGEQP
jgi:electron transport complex protein RnfG